MVRLSGARVIRIGTANHCDTFHLRGALSPRTAAVLYVVNGAISAAADLVPLERCVAIANAAGVPVIVDAAAEPDVRPFLRAGASIVIASGALTRRRSHQQHALRKLKALICACWPPGGGASAERMKVGKEGVAGLIAAVERWYARGPADESACYSDIVAALSGKLDVRPAGQPHRVGIQTSRDARQIANLLREGDPPIWVNDAIGSVLTLDLRNLTAAGAAQVAARILSAMSSNAQPNEDVPYHDLYWSEARLLRWPD